MTFDKHPLTEIFPRYAPRLLSNNQIKAEKIANLGIDFIFFKPFTEQLRTSSPEEFIKNFVLNELNIDTLIVGFNYNFGYKGEGTPETLKELGKKYNFDVVVIDPLLIDRVVVSSTRIRDLLAEGKVEEIKKLLGTNYKIRGTIQKGKQMGRQFGIPTANLKVNNNIQLPKSGVYFTEITIDGKKYDGLTNLGNNPTFRNHPYSVETYIFDFDDYIYGKEVELEFKNFIRGERQFNSLDELFDCIKSNIKDVEENYRKHESKKI